MVGTDTSVGTPARSSLASRSDRCVTCAVSSAFRFSRIPISKSWSSATVARSSSGAVGHGSHRPRGQSRPRRSLPPFSGDASSSSGTATILPPETGTASTGQGKKKTREAPVKKWDADDHTSGRSLTHLAGNLSNKPAARGNHRAQLETGPALNRSP